jgi:hypothetical protein
MDQADRIRIDLPKGPDGYFIDTGLYDEDIEDHILQGMARIHFYADDSVGHRNTLDPSGRYRCGSDMDEGRSCNRFNPDPGGSPVGTCTTISGPINGDTGGCDYWEIFRRVLDAELNYAVKIAPDGIYVEHPDGEGFGCIRCIHGQHKALEVSNPARDRFCRMFGVRVSWYACCNKNERKPVIIFENGEAKLLAQSALTSFPEAA